VQELFNIRKLRAVLGARVLTRVKLHNSNNFLPFVFLLQSLTHVHTQNVSTVLRLATIPIIYKKNVALPVLHTSTYSTEPLRSLVPVGCIVSVTVSLTVSVTVYENDEP